MYLTSLYLGSHYIWNIPRAKHLQLAGEPQSAPLIGNCCETIMHRQVIMANPKDSKQKIEQSKSARLNLQRSCSMFCEPNKPPQRNSKLELFLPMQASSGQKYHPTKIGNPKPTASGH